MNALGSMLYWTLKCKGSFVYTFLSSETGNEIYEYMTVAFELSFVATDCSHLSQGNVSSGETHGIYKHGRGQAARHCCLEEGCFISLQI